MKGPIVDFWGKLSLTRDAWHPLIDHCADVLGPGGLARGTPERKLDNYSGSVGRAARRPAAPFSCRAS